MFSISVQRMALLGLMAAGLSACTFLPKSPEPEVVPHEEEVAPAPVALIDRVPPSDHYWVVRTDEGVAFRSDSGVTFRTGGAVLSPEAAPFVDEVARVLNEQLADRQRILIAGHTDSAGNRTQNLRLSQRRAESVMKALVERGVSQERLTASGFGPDRPVSDNQSREGRAANRRTEVIVLFDEPPPPERSCVCSAFPTAAASKQ